MKDRSREGILHGPGLFRQRYRSLSRQVCAAFQRMSARGPAGYGWAGPAGKISGKTIKIHSCLFKKESFINEFLSLQQTFLRFLNNTFQSLIYRQRQVFPFHFFKGQSIKIPEKCVSLIWSFFRLILSSIITDHFIIVDFLALSIFYYLF